MNGLDPKYKIFKNDNGRMYRIPIEKVSGFKTAFPNAIEIDDKDFIMPEHKPVKVSEQDFGTVTPQVDTTPIIPNTEDSEGVIRQLPKQQQSKFKKYNNKQLSKYIESLPEGDEKREAIYEKMKRNEIAGKLAFVYLNNKPGTREIGKIPIIGKGINAFASNLGLSMTSGDKFKFKDIGTAAKAATVSMGGDAVTSYKIS